MTRDRLSWGLVAILIAAGALMAWSALDRDLWPLMVGLAFTSGIVLVRLYRRNVLGVGAVLLVAVVLRLCWIGVPPALSDDAFRYSWDGMLVAEGVNPYLHVPADSLLVGYRGHASYALMNSREFYSVYPPVSQYLFWAADRTTGSRFPHAFFVFKAILVLLEVVALFLLAKWVSARALMLFAWNPVVLIAGAGQAHTDVLLALPLVLAVAAARRNRWGTAGGAVAMAALVKIWPIFVVPAFWRRGRAVAVGLLVAGGLSVPFMAPDVIGNVKESLDLYVRYFEFNAGFYFAVKKVFLLITGDDWSKQLGPAFRWGFFAVAASIWAVAWRREWPLSTVLFAIAAWQLLLTTTVHPWYLYPILLLAALRERPEWAWQWLSVTSIGTYLLYIGGPYWWFVVIGWLGFLALSVGAHLPQLIQQALVRRARWKAEWIQCYLGDGVGPVLDVGGGEGYVAKALAALTGRRVEVLEVQDSLRVEVPSTLYDGDVVPFEDGRFSGVASVFTLHHAADPSRLLSEMGRISKGPIIVIESVYQGEKQHSLLRILDTLANRMRAGGRSEALEGTRRFRSADEWRVLMGTSGFRVIGESARYNLLHRKHLFVLIKNP